MSKYLFIANNLLHAMVEKGYTQKILSEKTDIPTPTINRYIKGYRCPKYDYAVRLSDALDIPVSQIYSDKKNSKKEVAIAFSIIANYCEDTLCGDCMFTTCCRDQGFTAPKYWEINYKEL